MAVLTHIIHQLNKGSEGVSFYECRVDERYRFRTIRNPVGIDWFEVMFPKAASRNLWLRSETEFVIRNRIKLDNLLNFVHYGRTSVITLKMNPRHPNQLTIYDKRKIPYLTHDFLADIFDLSQDSYFKENPVLITFNMYGSGASTMDHIHFQTEKRLPFFKCHIPQDYASTKLLEVKEIQYPVYGVLMTGEIDALARGTMRIMTSNNPAILQKIERPLVCSSSDELELSGLMNKLLAVNMYIDVDPMGNIGVLVIPRTREFAPTIANPLASCEIGGKFVLARYDDFVDDYSYYLDALKSVTLADKREILGFRTRLLGG